MGLDRVNISCFCDISGMFISIWVVWVRWYFFFYFFFYVVVINIFISLMEDRKGKGFYLYVGLF